MSEVFISCPSCKTLLLGDAAQCPSCEHIIDPERAAALGFARESSDITHHSEELACRKCGEMNAVGLVRCWNCGAFLREEIERLYQKMLHSRERIEYSPLPEISSSDMSGPKAAADAAAAPGPPPVDEAGGFELDESVADFVEDDAPAAAPASESAPEESGPPKAGEDQEADASDPRPHSEETGGDVLLEIALQEEQQAAKLKAAQKQKLARRRKSKAGRQQQRPAEAGKQRAAKASSKTPPNGMKQRDAAQHSDKPSQPADEWLTDVHLHEVVPAKVKLKPGSLQSQSRDADVGIAAERLVVAALVKPVGFFTLTRSSGGNKDDVRKALRKALRKGIDKAAADGPLPGAAHRILAKEQVARIKVVQPTAFLHESMFAGVSVFGEGRIAVLLPSEAETTNGEAAEAKTEAEAKPKAKPDPQADAAWFLSFPLSQFRRFSALLDRRFGVKGLGLADGVPLEDRMKTVQCHYSEEKFDALPVEELPFYQADPETELELRGHRCTACGLVVSEESRRKEKIGGLSGKGLAKAKCPKCGGKFGSAPLYQVKRKTPPSDTESSKSGETAAVEKAAV